MQSPPLLPAKRSTIASCTGVCPKQLAKGPLLILHTKNLYGFFVKRFLGWSTIIRRKRNFEGKLEQKVLGIRPNSHYSCLRNLVCNRTIITHEWFSFEALISRTISMYLYRRNPLNNVMLTFAALMSWGNAKERLSFCCAPVMERNKRIGFVEVVDEVVIVLLYFSTFAAQNCTGTIGERKRY